MNYNVGVQHPALVAWDLTSSNVLPVKSFIRYAFTFQVLTTLAADTVFQIQGADDSAADNCVPGPFVDIPEVAICDTPMVPAASTTFTLTAGTGPQICSATLTCRSYPWLRVVPVSGNTDQVYVALTGAGIVGGGTETYDTFSPAFQG